MRIVFHFTEVAGAAVVTGAADAVVTADALAQGTQGAVVADAVGAAVTAAVAVAACPPTPDALPVEAGCESVHATKHSEAIVVKRIVLFIVNSKCSTTYYFIAKRGQCYITPQYDMCLKVFYHYDLLFFLCDVK